MNKYSEIQEIKRGVGAVNDLLKQGWELIAAVGLDSGMVYVVGKQEYHGTTIEDHEARGIAARLSATTAPKKK